MFRIIALVDIYQKGVLLKPSRATEHKLMGTVPQAKMMKTVLETTQFNLDTIAVNAQVKFCIRLNLCLKTGSPRTTNG